MSKSPAANETRYHQDTRLPTQEISGESVIVVPAKSEMHLLDEVGTFIWLALRLPVTATDLVTKVREEFEVGPAQAERDVREFLATLLGKGLVIPE